MFWAIESRLGDYILQDTVVIEHPPWVPQGSKQCPLEITFYFPCGGVLLSFLLRLNPALGAYCSGNSWNIMKEYLFIQGAFQGHRKTFEVTPFFFSNYVWVFSCILRNALCKRLKPLLTALSSVFWCSVQITPSTSNQIASQEKISLGMKLGSLTVSFYIVIWKNHFSAAGTVPLKVVKVIIYLAPAGQGMLLSHTHSLIVFTALSSTIVSDSEPRV